MKKIKFITIFVFALLMALVMNVGGAHADAADLYDDATYNSQGGDVITLLEYSEYQVVIEKLSGAPNNDYFAMDLSQASFTVEILVDGGSIDYQVYDGDSNYWDTFTTTSFTFETTSETDIEIAVSTEAYEQLLDAFASNYDIQVTWLGNTEPVDTVAPEYTYQSAEVDSPYYDLVTVVEIQNQLSATDDVDGDVSASIQVYEDHYTSITPKVIGDEYYIMFSVEDTSGNAAYLRVDINIIDDLKPLLENGQSTFSDGAYFDFDWFDDEYEAVNDALEEFLYFSTITDGYYGDVAFGDPTAEADGWSFSQNLGSYDGDVAGTYTVTNTATDPSGNSMTFTFNVTVNANHAPVINGPSEVSHEAVGFNVNDVLADYTATDTEDGSLTVSVVSHNVTANDIGSYSITLSATDAFGVETTRAITVNLVDTTDPQFKIDGINTSGTYSHTVYMSDTTSLQALIDTITVIDAYDGDLTSVMVIPTYPNFAIPGTSTMTLTATDSSGNSSALNIEVTIEDDIAPVINGAVKIVKGISETLTLSDILAELNVSDNVDSSLTLDLVIDNYTGNSTNIGSYLVRYSATDTAGNTTIHDVRVWVIDNESPVFIINDYFFNISSTDSMTRDALVTLLQQSGMIGSDISYTVSFLTDEYTGNESTPGVYDVQMHITFDDGSEDNISLQINVEEDDETDVIDVDVDENLSKFEKAVQWVKNAWSDTKGWFGRRWQNIKDGYNWVADIFRTPENEDVPTAETTTQSTITTASELPLTSGEQPTTTELPYTPTTDLPLQELSLSDVDLYDANTIEFHAEYGYYTSVDIEYTYLDNTLVRLGQATITVSNNGSRLTDNWNWYLLDKPVDALSFRIVKGMSSSGTDYFTDNEYIYSMTTSFEMVDSSEPTLPVNEI